MSYTYVIIGNLATLKGINFSDNPLEFPPTAIQQQGIQVIGFILTVYSNQLHLTTNNCYETEIKMSFVIYKYTTCTTKPKFQVSSIN